MNVNSVNSTNVSNQNFKARLITTPNLEKYYVSKTRNQMFYRAQMMALSEKLKPLAPQNADVIISLTDRAGEMFNRGIMPNAPAAEMTIGKVINQYDILATEKKAFDIVGYQGSFLDEVYSYAVDMLERFKKANPYIY